MYDLIFQIIFFCCNSYPEGISQCAIEIDNRVPLLNVAPA